ncbi:hypothetical protein GGI00_000187 [Coemansia sp. RSA 2681]|nr:hypothetical protein GGI00_000187 [Coemansia sp. RSA 2681]KAJ2456126.1 hypothetical protein GGF42_003296 [Coemansia sp. RSA 2424]
MRFYCVFAALACLLASVNSTYVQVRNGPGVSKTYEVQDTLCYKVDNMFNGTFNQVYISGYPTRVYANSDCTYEVGLLYMNDKIWHTIPRPIRSFSVAPGYN